MYKYLIIFIIYTSLCGVASAQEIRLYAAGSLRAAMTEVGAAFRQAEGVAVAGVFGPSGLLRARIEKGEPAEVFTSADMGHPGKLHGAGLSGPVALFTRNRLCALTGPRAAVTSANLLERMLDPAVKLGTSTPKADPSGDYAWLLFEKAGKLRPGAFETLSAKAMKLTGGPDSPPPPKGRNQYGAIVSAGTADVFLTYCTNALAAKKEAAELEIVQAPEALAVGADYGMTVLKGASEPAQRFARFILSDSAQRILASHGFAAVK